MHCARARPSPRPPLPSPSLALTVSLALALAQVRDLGSTYGTRVNGKPLGAEPTEVKVGDVVILGASSFQLQAVPK